MGARLGRLYGYTIDLLSGMKRKSEDQTTQASPKRIKSSESPEEQKKPKAVFRECTLPGIPAFGIHGCNKLTRLSSSERRVRRA